MRLTIIPNDGAVYQNGLCYSGLTWDETPDNVHALQWFDTQGWIEFKDENPYDNMKPTNETITELPQWALNAMAAWDIANQPVPEPAATEEVIVNE